MSEKTEEKHEKEERQRARPSLVWPVILITAGVLWLLNTTGSIDLDWWRLVRLWPVLLILWGIEVLLGGRSLFGNLLVVILVVAIAVGVAFYVVSDAPARRGEGVAVDRFEEPLDGLERAQLDIGMPAGELVMGALSDTTDLAIRGELDLAGRRRPEWSFIRTGTLAEMALTDAEGSSFRSFAPGDNETWTLQVSPAVELSLSAELGAGELEFDLAGLDVTDLDVQTAVGQCLVTLPAEGRLEGTLRTVIGRLVVEVPPTMAAQIRLDRAFTTVSMPPRFREVKEGLYQTEGWEGSDDRVDLTLEVVIGQITVQDAPR